MYRCLICLLLTSHVLAARAPDHPIVLPDKYAADKYARLQPYERQRCDRLVSERMLIEKRRQLGALHSAIKTDMDKRADQIDKDYDRYCINATLTGPIEHVAPPAQSPARP